MSPASARPALRPGEASTDTGGMLAQVRGMHIPMWAKRKWEQEGDLLVVGSLLSFPHAGGQLLPINTPHPNPSLPITFCLGLPTFHLCSVRGHKMGLPVTRSIPQTPSQVPESPELDVLPRRHSST